MANSGIAFDSAYNPYTQQEQPQTSNQVMSTNIAGPGLGLYGPQDTYSTGQVLGASNDPAVMSTNIAGPGLGLYGPQDTYTAPPTPTTNPTTPTTNPSTPTPTSAPPIPDNSQLFDEINQQAAEQYGLLDQAESNLKGAQVPALKEINDQYGLSKQLLDTEANRSRRTASTATSEATRREENALAAARRLYNELKMGGRQRYGGASSAGQAFGELSARELQRNQFNIRQNYQTAMSQIAEQKIQTEENYRNSLLQLQQQKQAALNKANEEFQNKMMEINRLRTEIGVNKSKMRLDALMQLRNQTFEISMQDRQFQQALAQQRQANTTALDQALAQLNTSNQGITNAYNTQQANTPLNYQTSLVPTLRDYGYGFDVPIGQIGKSIYNKKDQGLYGG